MINALSIIASLSLPGPILASTCYSLRDFDRRLECLARERGSPATCESIHNWDQRQWCRERSKRSGS